MRDPERIDRILALVHELWLKSPDQRFGQLLANATDRVIEEDNGLVLWNMEDYEWEKYFRDDLGIGWPEYDDVKKEEERKMMESWTRFLNDMPNILKKIRKEEK